MAALHGLENLVVEDHSPMGTVNDRLVSKIGFGTDEQVDFFARFEAGFFFIEKLIEL